MMMNMPGYRHSVVCGRVSRYLGNFVDENGLGTVGTNDGGIITGHDPDTVRGADVAFYSFSKMPRDFQPKGYPTALPELVFEVLSPSDEWKEIHAKVGEYLTAGIQTVCVVDPETESVIAYHADKRQTMFGIDDTLTLDVLPGFSVAVRKLFHA